MNKYDVIFENDEYLVINKPAGLLVHGAEHIQEPTLVDELLANYPEIAKVGDDPTRPGIMHRLDKLVSGLMVIAKTQASFDSLKSQFKKRTIQKKYTALVHGKVIKDYGEIDFPIGRSSQGFKMAAKPATIKGERNLSDRQAITEFSIAKRFINYTLLDVKIITGRTHQIRVHLAAYNHPIVGDDLYGTKRTKEKNKKLGLDRIYLVCSELGFKDLNGNEQCFKINIPEKFEKLLKTIK